MKRMFLRDCPRSPRCTKKPDWYATARPRRGDKKSQTIGVFLQMLSEVGFDDQVEVMQAQRMAMRGAKPMRDSAAASSAPQARKRKAEVSASKPSFEEKRSRMHKTRSTALRPSNPVAAQTRRESSS